MTTDVAVKDLLLGRPLDDGSSALRFQVPPLSIPRLMRGRLLPLLRKGPDSSEDVAMFLADAGRQPETRTTEGEELVMCTARYDLASPDLGPPCHRPGTG